MSIGPDSPGSSAEGFGVEMCVLGCFMGDVEEGYFGVDSSGSVTGGFVFSGKVTNVNGAEVIILKNLCNVVASCPVSFDVVGGVCLGVEGSCCGKHDR